MDYDRSNRKYTIVVDTREKKPIIFPDCVNTVKRALNPGDYTILGYEKILAIERKSADDYISCALNFKHLASQLQRLKKLDYKMLLVTSSYLGTLEQLGKNWYLTKHTTFKQFNGILHYAERLGVTVCFIDEILVSDFILNTFDIWLKWLKEKEKNKQCEAMNRNKFFKGK